MKRIQLSKKTRFEIFKRDEFTCQYCGRTPPDAVLEVDHIHPVVKGGDNEQINLLTSCFECNRGKGKTELSLIPKTVSERYEIIKEREDQVKAYNRLIKRIRVRQEKDIDYLSDIFSMYTERGFSPSFRESIRSNFIEKLDINTLESALHRACQKFEGRSGESVATNTAKYFCGICWNLIKGRSKY